MSSVIARGIWSLSWSGISDGPVGSFTDVWPTKMGSKARYVPQNYYLVEALSRFNLMCKMSPGTPVPIIEMLQGPRLK